MEAENAAEDELQAEYRALRDAAKLERQPTVTAETMEVEAETAVEEAVAQAETEIAAEEAAEE